MLPGAPRSGGVLHLETQVDPDLQVPVVHLAGSGAGAGALGGECGTERVTDQGVQRGSFGLCLRFVLNRQLTEREPEP